jgi:hypothetical protein
MTLKKLAVPPPPIEAPAASRAGRRAVGRSRPPAANAVPHRQPAQNASRNAQTPAFQPFRKRRGGPVPSRRTLAPGVLPSARLASPHTSSGRAGAISPDARSRHPAFRSLDAGLAFAILASLGQHTPARLAPAHPSRTRSSGARRISALARAAPALPYRYASAVSAGAGPYLSGAIVKLARPWLTLRTAAE